MKAMVFEEAGKPLLLQELPIPKPLPYQILIKVKACGVCRTDVHIADGELNNPLRPLTLGHQAVGEVVAKGSQDLPWTIGENIGVPWLGYTCSQCRYCLSGQENLCDNALFTGYTLQGGFAEYMVVHSEYALRLQTEAVPEIQAPFLCAGLIGFRAYRLLGEIESVGLYGFGSSAHLLIQALAGLKKNVYVFTREGDVSKQAFARKLGAIWAGGSDEKPPVMLDGALIFAPVGALYPQALRCIRKGGKVISAGIHMSDIPSFPYQALWGERSMGSVANLTREDGRIFLDVSKHISIEPEVTLFPLEEANEALEWIRKGKGEGSCVLKI